MGIFGPSKDKVWRQLSEEIGAEFVEGRFWSGNRVQAHVAPWTITLDTYTVSTGHSHVTYTRMRAPYVNPDGLRFTLYRNGLFSELGKLLGMQDIEVGVPEFDDAFIVKGTDEYKVRELFADARIRALALAQPTIRLSVKDDEGWFGAHFPKGVDELHFQVVGVLKDVKRLKALFDLFALTLDRLCQTGSGRMEEPGVTL
ncbi:DUF3137 domain-containing protein [Singulisphaera sp. Ch08]|uniref:DUF3137 domain-containing protein n=1 Tax=Singulisphaera sp. Ch08 TaxID=3120278 RepID=A0AAU7CMK3_9BACT